MFEKFTDTVTLVRMIQAGDTDRLRKAVHAGARIDRRTTYDPWMTPLDAAASTGDVEVASVLLNAGAPILGSSIYEAILHDHLEVLRLFHRVDAKFHQRFDQDSNNRANPRLNRWLSLFTARDLAVSVHSVTCANFLQEIGALHHPRTKPHQVGSCTAVFIEEESFLSFGGVNVNGLAESTSGFYCAKCGYFVR